MGKFEDNKKDSLSLHVAGATKQHKGQFSSLKVIENSAPLDQEFIAKYVARLYLGPKDSTEFRNGFTSLKEEINTELVKRLLGDFNWRPRSIGAYFSATHNLIELEKNIGHLLLRSDLCYVGHHYCLALASFSTSESVRYLNQYLEYYLEQTDLWFDQQSAMAALAYIGAVSGEDLLLPHMKSWEMFIRNKPNWSLSSSIESFSKEMQILNQYKLDVTSR